VFGKSDLSQRCLPDFEDYDKDIFTADISRAQNTKIKRILLVDDEPYNLLALKIILEAADEHKIITSLIDHVINGLEAVKAVETAYLEGNFQYGLIFMDCSMPIMDGYTATDKIRGLKNIQQPMIVACTGHSETEYIKKAFRH
jgi:CheY-like chemotaxis protein